jgi:hypothetical protein
MGMPQKEVFEKLIFRGDKRKVSVSFLLQGSGKLIQLTMGRANELWNVVPLAPLTFVLKPIPTQDDNDISSTIHMIAFTGNLAFRSGTTIPK